MLRLAHGLVANSQHARQTLMSQGVEPRKIELLPNVIDLLDFDARSTEPLRISPPSDRIIVTAVGGLHPCKRFDRFLEALALARRSEPALAGVILASHGPAVVYGINSASYLAVIAALFAIRASGRAVAREGQAASRVSFSALKEGLSFVWKTPIIVQTMTGAGGMPAGRVSVPWVGTFNTLSAGTLVISVLRKDGEGGGGIRTAR